MAPADAPGRVAGHIIRTMARYAPRAAEVFGLAGLYRLSRQARSTTPAERSTRETRVLARLRDELVHVDLLSSVLGQVVAVALKEHAKAMLQRVRDLKRRVAALLEQKRRAGVPQGRAVRPRQGQDHRAR